jgi:hypothetical protein
MATDAQRARRRAQRATAKAVRENRAKIKARIKPERRLPETTTRKARQAATEYGYRVLNGTEPTPRKGTPEGRQLAHLAGKARWGKADPVFLAAFQQYFYHDDKPSEDAAEEQYDYEDEDTEEKLCI